MPTDNQALFRERSVLHVPAGADSATLELPLLTARGKGDGPHVVILGGVHGDEPEGITAASAIWRTVDLERGSLTIVPECNLPAVVANTRSSPVDDKNLARTFPGKPEGTLTERIANLLSENIIRRADFLIDLHSAGQHYAMPLLAGCYAAPDALGAQCEAAARAFGAPVYWAHPDIAPGRSLSVALEANIPNLYVECGGGGRVRQADFSAYVEGVRRVLAHLGCLPPLPAPAAPTLQLRSTGDLDTWLTVEVAGILLERAGVLDAVCTDQTLGIVVDPGDGSTLQELKAPFDGVVIMARRTARVRPGDGAYMIALPDA
jgi:N2-acetyl-L-2,4-diaminobutanoate deacetylase